MDSAEGNVACQTQEQQNVMPEVVNHDQQVVEKNDSESESPADVDGELSEVSPSLSGSGLAAAAAAAAAVAAKLSDLDTSDSSSIEDLVAGAVPEAPKDAIDRLLMKQRRELMSELRTIQNSHRPVSKGDQRRRLDRFFRQHLHGDVSDTTSEGSNDDDPPRRRRNGVVVSELEGLTRQGSVTQRLRCNTFRRDLENMIRGAVVRQEQEIEAALRLRTAGLPGNRPYPLSAAGGAGGAVETGSHVSGVSSHSSHSSFTGGIPVPPPPPPAPGQYHYMPPPPPPSQNNFPPPSPSWQAPARHPVPQQHAPQHHAPQPQPHAQPQSDNSRWPLPTAPWLVQNSAGNGQQANPNMVVQQSHREAIVSEITELVHRQVVHHSLESQFRNQLEYLMLNRLNTTEGDGEQVMNYVQSIPQSQHHRRNDFSHLGIHINQHRADEGGAMGRGTVPAAFMQEMDSLRSRMDELHEMVRMSMEMQFDLQRAIRQEVSAALHHQNGTGAAPPASSSVPLGTQAAAEGNCIICLDKEVDAVLYQCGHMCVCVTCGQRLSRMGSHCPMCRAPIRDVIRAYRSQRT